MKKIIPILDSEPLSKIPGSLIEEVFIKGSNFNTTDFSLKMNLYMSFFDTLLIFTDKTETDLLNFARRLDTECPNLVPKKYLNNTWEEIFHEMYKNIQLFYRQEGGVYRTTIPSVNKTSRLPDEIVIYYGARTGTPRLLFSDFSPPEHKEQLTQLLTLHNCYEFPGFRPFNP